MNNNAGLLELVARGKKDLFFTSNPKVAFFHSVYVRPAPFVKEIYISKPRNIPEWGKWVDFDLEHRGDITRNTYLRIELPSWLPPHVQATNKTGLVTYDEKGTTYGYCNNIGFQMIEKIQFFQDQVKLHEIFGEYLDWRTQQSTTLSKTALFGQEIGAYVDSPLGIGRTASGMSLRVPFSILGYQALTDAGLPMVALKKERFRIRVHLRKLEEVIVASDGRVHPNPWSQPLFVQSVKNGPIDTSQTSLPKTSAKTIGISLETTQIYVPNYIAMFLKAQTLRFPFQTVQFQQYTLEDNRMTAASINPNVVYKHPLTIDCIGSVSRMLLAFRTEASLQAGQRTELRSPVTKGEFVQTIRANIANMDRVKQWPTQVFRELTGYWKQMQTSFTQSQPRNLYTITFGGYDSPRQPAGTINFTRAINAILYLTLAPIEYDPRIVSRTTYATLYAESWNVYEISNGAGRCMFDDS